MLREEFDDNKTTRRRPLGDHISRTVYTVVQVIQHDLVKIRPTDSESTGDRIVHISRIRKYNNVLTDSENESEVEHLNG